ncbi:hypothetical protein GF406_23250 [candidate division KSB1 bacterium]|nr:hypothetical protein [candidate division KSB1 bacterium]
MSKRQNVGDTMGSGQKKNYAISQSYTGIYDPATFNQLQDASISSVPWQQYAVAHDPHNATGYTIGDIARGFMETFQEAQKSADEVDLISGKAELSTDKIDLILGDIQARDQLTYANLQRLYDDLARIGSLRLEMSTHPDYLPDKTKLDLHKMEMQAHDLIRRELKDASRELGFAHKELRESLLEAKLQGMKTALMNDDGAAFDSLESLESSLGVPNQTDSLAQSYAPWGGDYS